MLHTDKTLGAKRWHGWDEIFFEIQVEGDWETERAMWLPVYSKGTALVAVALAELLAL